MKTRPGSSRSSTTVALKLSRPGPGSRGGRRHGCCPAWLVKAVHPGSRRPRWWSGPRWSRAPRWSGLPGRLAPLAVAAPPAVPGPATGSPSSPDSRFAATSTITRPHHRQQAEHGDQPPPPPTLHHRRRRQHRPRGSAPRGFGRRVGRRRVGRRSGAGTAAGNPPAGCEVPRWGSVAELEVGCSRLSTAPALALSTAPTSAHRQPRPRRQPLPRSHRQPRLGPTASPASAGTNARRGPCGLGRGWGGPRWVGRGGGGQAGQLGPELGARTGGRRDPWTGGR